MNKRKSEQMKKSFIKYNFQLYLQKLNGHIYLLHEGRTVESSLINITNYEVNPAVHEFCKCPPLKRRVKSRPQCPHSPVQCCLIHMQQGSTVKKPRAARKPPSSNQVQH